MEESQRREDNVAVGDHISAIGAKPSGKKMLVIGSAKLPKDAYFPILFYNFKEIEGLTTLCTPQSSGLNSGDNDNTFGHWVPTGPVVIDYLVVKGADGGRVAVAGGKSEDLFPVSYATAY
nr:hypothetical protein Iba_chr11cCG6320 [Ipomoea batatas]